jgi:hypothetical protein
MRRLRHLGDRLDDVVFVKRKHPLAVWLLLCVLSYLSETRHLRFVTILDPGLLVQQLLRFAELTTVLAN